MRRSPHAIGLVLLFSTFAFLSVGSIDGGEPGKRKAAPAKGNPVLQAIADDPTLPRILLIGDSISMGYTLPVRKLLEGRANVHRPLTNCGPTTTGLEQIDQWLGDKPWDVIHFNWGLHDLKYVGGDRQSLADPQASGSRQQVPPDAYEANLRRLVQRLKKTEAVLIWCSTTPVPEGAQGRVTGDAAKYNEIAARIMQEEGIAIDDLYAFAKSRLSEIQQPSNVHFTPAGSQALAEEVVRVITEVLRARSQKSGS